MVGWHHRLNGHECLNKLRETVKDREAWCTAPWSCKGSDMTERLTAARLPQFTPLLLCLFYGSEALLSLF